MKILKCIELIDLAIYTHKNLIFTDFHIGFEEALNKEGLMVPRFQFQDTLERLEKIFSRLKGKTIERIIINGDIKHEFGAISLQEWKNVLKLLSYLGGFCNEIVLIKGNHDTSLGPVAEKKIAGKGNINILEHFLITPNKKANILVTHGDEIPNKSLLKDVSTIIIGHEHPAVSIKEGARIELFKAYLIGRWHGRNIIVQPSFKLAVEGTDVTKEELLSPFLRGNIGNFNAIIIADKLYKFGKVKGL